MPEMLIDHVFQKNASYPFIINMLQSYLIIIIETTCYGEITK